MCVIQTGIWEQFVILDEMVYGAIDSWTLYSEKERRDDVRAQHPDRGSRAVLCWALPAFPATTFSTPSCSLHCRCVHLLSVLRLRRPLLPQTLQTCHLLCCQASCAHNMQPIPVHPSRSSLDCHFPGEVSVGGTPPFPELASSAFVCSQHPLLFLQSSTTVFNHVGGCAIAVLFPTWSVSSLMARTGSPV